MIQGIEWEKHGINEFPSPFMRGVGERPLRITLHSESLVNLSGKDKEVIGLILELANLKEIEIFKTSPNDFPYIVVEEPKPEDDFIPVKLVYKNESLLFTLVHNKGQWPIIAAQMVSPSSHSNKASDEMLQLLVLAQAHRAVGGDILITKSHLLQSSRNQPSIRETNPRTPLEAAQIIGLFLRSRGNYVYRAAVKGRMSFDRGGFYWVLTRYHLPNMWKYFSACVAASKLFNNDIQYLGEAILIRAARALEARDYIGIEFYKPSANIDSDQVMYHFDYLTLVLAGAIDAQARVANRVYQMTTREKSASFRIDKFRKALGKSGADELFKFSSSEKFISLFTLLYDLRNTIHGATLKAFTYQGSHGTQQTLLEVPESIGQRILSAVNQLGGAIEWGIDTTFKRVWLEPYAYSVALTREILLAIDEIALSTDVERLFRANGKLVPTLNDKAPSNSIFTWGRRLSFLG